jgi:hypothetical protein
MFLPPEPNMNPILNIHHFTSFCYGRKQVFSCHDKSLELECIWHIQGVAPLKEAQVSPTLLGMGVVSEFLYH